MLRLDCMFLSFHVRVSKWIHTIVAWMSRNSSLETDTISASLSNCNGAWTHNLVRKRPHDHLAKLAKWLRYVVSNYLYGAFDCMFLSSHVRVSERIHTLSFYSCLNVEKLLAQNRRYLKFKYCNGIRIPLLGLYIYISDIYRNRFYMHIIYMYHIYACTFIFNIHQVNDLTKLKKFILH